MQLPAFVSRALSFAARNERPLGAVLFAFGFITDLLTFGLLPIGIVNIFFLSYLALAAVCTFGTHLISVYKERDVWWRKVLAVVFPLGAQYAFGGIFSGFVVFYTKSSVLAVSWPFIVLLALVYFGNEYFRMHKAHLVYQTALFFFAFYAYAIFALPLFVHTIGPWVFLGSTALAIVVIGFFLWLLRRVNKTRFSENARSIFASCGVIVILVCGSYFGGLIPPIPLALTDGGAYHSLMKVPGGYRVETEAPRPWWDIRTPVLHVTPGSPVYAYSAVGAPISFSSTVVHRWEHYRQGKWVTEGRISFPISGGRVGGYRGYSVKENLAPGKWMVSVETPSGQVIGRIRFDIENADQRPALQEEIL
ncbi:MAG TPA: DUF2914 domain-containing protein [Candidatus Paceibacterota bacterium]|nr:DUF2914 domain-containing protein [Candidatus Paceibacterota bacterium]